MSHGVMLYIGTRQPTGYTMKWPLSDSLRQYFEVQYQLERVLGEGGMGAVILATERALERRVAIKVLRREIQADEGLRERFRREARTAARLTHPNIVPLLTFGDVEGEMFYVMGFVDGETLAERLHRVGTLGTGDVRALVADLADALDYAHAAGIVHRDLKPENVLLDRASGRPMLTDFGIARQISGASALTGTGVIVGTPHYMSPEQASGDPTIDGRSDIYSLGIIAYRAVAGRLPFAGGSVRDVIGQHLAAVPEPLPADRVDGDPLLAEAILRALNKDPATRWQRARDLATAVRDAEMEEVLPEELTAIEGQLANIVGAAFVFSTFFAGLWAAGIGWLTGKDAAGVVVGIGLWASVFGWVAARSSYRKLGPKARYWRLAWRPPRSWKHWWPLRFRRPGDVWHRLPREARWLRLVQVTMLWVFGSLLVVFMVRVVNGRPDDAVVRWLVFAADEHRTALVFGLTALIGMPISAYVWLMHRLSRRFGVSTAFLIQVQQLPNVDARWRQERYARLLSPETSTQRPVADATGHRDAIEQLVRELRRADLPLPGELLDAVRAADSAAADIAREMARLRTDVDPDELARVDRRLAALGASPRDADVRGLLQSQRDLMKKLEVRLGSLGAHKTRLDEQLRLLHRQLLELRARGADSHAEITGRIRAVNDELRRLGEGWDSVDHLTTPA